MSPSDFATPSLQERNATGLTLQTELDLPEPALVEIGGRIVHANAAFRALLGYRSGLAWRPVRSLLAPVSREAATRRSEDVESGRRLVVRDREEWLRQDGGPVMLEVVATRCAVGGRPASLVLVRPIAESEAAETVRSQLTAVVESSDDAIITASLDGRITTWNEGARRLLGYRGGEIVGAPIGRLVPPGELDEQPLIWQRILFGERLRNHETRWRRKDGRLIDVSLTVSPIRDRRGEIVGISKIARDVSDLRRSEEVLRATLAEKQVLLQEVHHRVKNNLLVLSSLISLHEAKADDPAMRSVFQEWRSRISAMALLHTSLQDSADGATVDLAEFVRRLVPTMVTNYGLNSNRIAVETRLLPVPLGFDAVTPFSLVLNELVSNALLHAFPADRPGRLRIELGTGDDGRRRLVVADDGIGLPEHVDLSRPKSMGLRIVHTLVRQLGGQLDCSRGDGTVFCLVF